MKLDLVRLSHTTFGLLEKRYRTMFFKINLVIHVGFQKVRYLWILSKKLHHLGPIYRSLGLHLCILGQKTQMSVCDIRL